MLKLVIGRSGSGKTTALYNELKERAAESAPLFLLVPEQASYENERRLLTELGPVLSQKVQVTSFTHMTRTAFREIGGIGGRRLDPTLSLLLISQALHSVADHLSVYRRHVDSPDYLQSLAGMLCECKQCAITPSLMTDVAATLPEGLLRGKVTELALIFEAYEALLSQAELVDPLDDLTWLAKVLPDCHTFDGAHVYVDGFKGFTKQELLVLERLMARAASLTVTLCTTTVTVHEGQEFDRFAVAIRTAAELRDAAYRAHVPVAVPQVLTENHRTSDPALLTLEQGCFAVDVPSYDEPTDAVTVTACTDRAEECRYAARLIRRLLRENGGQCRDYTIVARDMAAYADLMETALRREGLPYCRDYREPVATQPLITLVASALAAVARGWDTGDILRIVGSGLAGFSATSSAQLENYVFVWNVRRGQWRQPFTEHPDGLTAVADEQSDARLEHLNRLRRRLVEPLEALSARLAGRCNGRQFADAVYRFLKDLRVARSVRLRVAQLDAANEHALADHQARMWDYLIALLDKFAAGLSDTVLPVARFEELFRLAVSGDDLGSIPQGLDGVVIGSVDRIRYTQPRTVIVLGANEGVLPAYPSSGGMLTDYERRQLIGAGLPMVNDADHQTAEERFFAYAAVAAPSERLIVTHARKNGKDPLFPSSLIAEIEQLVPKHAEGNARSVGESEADAFAELATVYRRNTAEAASYREVFASLPAYRGKLAAMDRIEDGFAFLDPQAAHDHFGDTLYLSPSQTEKFFKCRFLHFCEHTLRLKPRRTAEMSPMDAGTLAHSMMQTLLPLYYEADITTVTREQTDADTAQFVADYMETCMGGKEDRDARFLALMARLTEESAHLLWRVVRELQQSRFVATDHELSFGKEASRLPAWELALPSGATVRMNGSIDRVDTYQCDGKTYVRIVDYKTGSKSFDVAKLLAGLDVQLPIYLFALCENGDALYDNLTPSGMFYLTSTIPEVIPAASDTPEKLEKKRLKTMRMTGLALDDPSILQAMEADLDGIFIPAAMNSKGEIGTANLVSMEEFGTIRAHLQNLLDELATRLRRGDIAAVPSYNSQHPPCRYCAYHDICGHEAEDPEKKLEAIAVSDAIAAMKEVAENE